MLLGFASHKVCSSLNYGRNEADLPIFCCVFYILWEVILQIVHVSWHSESCVVLCICYSLSWLIIQIADFLEFVFPRMLSWISVEESNYINNVLGCFLVFMHMYIWPIKHASGTSLPLFVWSHWRPLQFCPSSTTVNYSLTCFLCCHFLW